ncbi:MAG: serine/threonine-protein kinase [Acidobacteriota bacterium]
MPRSEDSGQRLERILRIFEQAAERPAAERQAFLAEACAGDAEALRAVEEMLEADARDATFLDRPALQRADGESPTATLEAPEVSRGRRIGAYRLLRRIGQGGMGSVYLAVRDDKAFQRRVVVKLVRHGMESEDLNRRLEIERQILASLDHPNIARIYDGGTTVEGLPYFVMEYIEGERIDTYCDRNRLGVDERLALFLKICSAVQSAHQNLVIHRDLKPSNILVAADGEPKLLDFGIAKLLNPELVASSIEPTETWNRMLTPHYASPEQVRGEMVTTASDVYSLGVLLYQLLTGLLPFKFTSRSPREIERVFAEQEPAWPSLVADGRRTGTREATEDGTTEDAAQQRSATPRELARRLGGDLDAIVLKALREAPRRRYATVGQLAEDLQRHRDGRPVAARRPNWRYRAAKFAQRNRRAVAVALLFLGLMVAFSGGMAMMLQRVAKERDRVVVERNLARQERDRAEEEKRKKQLFLDWVLDLFHKSDPYVSDEEHSQITVRQALDRGSASLEHQAHEDPELHAELLQAIGVIYYNLGLFDQAEEQVEKARKIRQALYGDEHADVARAEAVLASVLKYREDGDLEAAAALSAEATDKLARLVGRSHVDFLEALNTRVSVLCFRREYQTAVPLAREALALSRRLGASDSKLAVALNNLSTAQLAVGDYEGALEHYTQTVELRRSLYGSGSPWLVKPLINLGIARRQLGQLEAAAEAYGDALEIQQRTLGETHVSLFPSLFNLARLLQADGRYPQALARYDEALEVLRQAVEPDHPNLLLLEIRRQEIRIELGEVAQANATLRGLLDRWRAVLGSESNTTIALGENILGHGLGRAGADDEALRLLEGSYAKLLANGRHRRQREALDRLAQFLDQRGESERAAEFRAMLPEATTD